MFIHRDAAWPGVVIDIPHPQNTKSLIDLKDHYILGTYGELKSSDEEKFKEAERRMRKKSERSDGPYGWEQAPAEEDSSQGSG